MFLAEEVSQFNTSRHRYLNHRINVTANNLVSYVRSVESCGSPNSFVFSKEAKKLLLRLQYTNIAILKNIQFGIFFQDPSPSLQYQLLTFACL